MSAYKQFLSSDVIVTPFEVNKGFTFVGATVLTGSNVGIDRFIGQNIQSNPFISGSNPTTGQISTLDRELVYESIKQLYYSNYLNSTSSYGSPATTASLVPGNDEAGNVLVGDISSAGKFDNYLQTTLTFQKYFPTSSNSTIGVLSIPNRLYGNNIQPNSFRWTSDSGSIYDDGEGNLIFQSTGEICGNIFYNHGIAVLTSDSQPLADTYGTGIYGSSLYGLSDFIVVENFVTSSNAVCSFSSSFTIYETQFKCTIRENEFNFSLNPSIISGSTDGTPYDFVTSSYFNPYVTTVGLYDEAQNLLAVGKLSQPLPISSTTDTTILINIDR
jgi:hypothetical protein